MPRTRHAQTTSTAIVLASSKGGTSKTTTAACLGVRVAKEGARVSLIDLDPQQSLARWHELRRRFDDNGNPGLFRRGDESPIDKVAMLKQAGAEWIFIDLPPGDFDIIEPGIAAADFVVIPVKASPLDLEAIDPVVETCEEFGKPFCFLLTMIDPKWSLSQTAVPYLEKACPGHVLKDVLGYRQAYVGAMIGGQTGPEYNKDAKQATVAAGEVDAVWRAIKTRATAAPKRAGK